MLKGAWGRGFPGQKTRVWYLHEEDPAGRGATKPASHNCEACALQQEKPLQWEAHAPLDHRLHSLQPESSPAAVKPQQPVTKTQMNNHHKKVYGVQLKLPLETHC